MQHIISSFPSPNSSLRVSTASNSILHYIFYLFYYFLFCFGLYHNIISLPLLHNEL